MASTYSTNLALELIGSGDQSGTWGTTTNTNLGTLIEQAISGYVTQAVSTGTDTTITIPSGASGVARNMIIEMTGTGGANTNLIVPANKKLYFVFNNTSSGQVTVKVAAQTGVSVPNGKKVLLASNGTDIVEQFNQVVGNLAVGGTLGVTGASTFSAAITYGGVTLSNAVTGTGNMVLATSPTITTPTITNPAYTAQTLTDAATVSWDMNSGSVATLTLGGNRTLAAPTNLKIGTSVLVVNQDGTGSRTITWNSIFKWTAGVAPVLSTAASAKDVITFFGDGTNLYGTLGIRGAA